MERSKILVWDLPLRVFHWLLALSFAGAFLTAESERYRDIHVLFGYTMLGLLAFRLMWAFVGSRHARLRAFAFGPRAVVAYLKSLLARRPLHYVGHNPAGSWAIYVLAALGIVTGVSGYMTYSDLGGKWLESLHEGAANTMLAMVVVHVAGVVVSSFLHRENLARAMVTGFKHGRPSDAIGNPRRMTAVALIFAVALIWSGVVDFPGLPHASAQTHAAAQAGAQPVHRERTGHDD